MGFLALICLVVDGREDAVRDALVAAAFCGQDVTIAAASPASSMSAHVHTPVVESVDAVSAPSTMHADVTVGDPISTPVVYSVSPAHGSPTTTTAITVTGDGFLPGLAAELFALADLDDVTYVDAQHFTATAPAHIGGSFAIAVTNTDSGYGGSATNILDYPPVLASLTPSTGPTIGGAGNDVDAAGEGFITGCVSNLGSVAFVSSSLVTITPDDHAAGVVATKITNPVIPFNTPALDSNTVNYTYALPTMIAIVPTSGPVAGSTHVVGQVSNSDGVTSLELDGVAVTSFATDDGTHVSGDTVAHSAGFVDVTASTSHGTTAPLVDAFTYLPPIPVVTAISPDNGLVIGGTAVEVTGSNYDNSGPYAFKVRIDGVECTSVVFVNSGRVTATTPLHLIGGPYDVDVIDSYAQIGTGHSLYTYD